MSDVKIQEASEATSANLTDRIPAYQGDLSRATITVQQIVDQVTGFAPALTADENYVTDAEKAVIGNTSGTNTGNETTGTIGALIEGAVSKAPAGTDKFAVRHYTSGLLAYISWDNIITALNTLYLGKTADVIEVTGTTATVLTTWNGKRVRFTNAAAVTLTIPATTGFTAGFQCSLFNDSANAVDVSFSGTVVASGTKIAQKKGATLRMDDVFRATGGLS